MNDTITIRQARLGDRSAILRLAELDACEAPSGPVLLAFVGAELRAALPLAGGEPIADPFRRTGGLVELLRLRADGQRERSRRSAVRMRLALSGR